jgi:hypothetical protein
MTMTSKSILRLQFLCRVVTKECRHLTVTDERLFVSMGFGLDQARRLECDADLSERVEAFVGRFARLQDTLGDKLLPEILRALGEPVGPVIDNLDRAERLGLLGSADEWLVMHNLRNQMVHEYVEDWVTLTDALQAAHAFIPALILATENMTAEAGRRGWVAN